jgi:hypothetical protein
MDYTVDMLLNEAPNDALVEALKRLGLYAHLPLANRPPLARLGWLDGRPTLHAADPDALFRHVQRRKTTAAFALAPAAELKRLDGAVFGHGLRYVRVTAADADERGPYHRRFVVLEFEGIAPPADLAADGPRVVSGEPPDLPLLLAEPLRFTLDGARAAELFALERKELAAANAVVLPATRIQAPDDGYFSRGRLRVRRALRELWRAAGRQADEPAGVTLWRLQDEPLLRDVLLDGGALRLVGDPGGPTALRLDVAGRHDGDATAAYRARFFLAADRGAGPPALKAAALAVAADVRALAPGGVRVAPAAAPTSWAVDATTIAPYDPAGPAEGTWQQLDATARALVARPDRAFIDRHVLRPSEARAGGNPDHDQAERRWAVHLARSADPDDAIWRRAFFPALLTYLRSADRPPPEARVAGEAARLRAEAVAGSWRCVHDRQVADDELTRWRLLFPLGACFYAESPGEVVSPAGLDGLEAYLLRWMVRGDDFPGLESFEVGASLLASAAEGRLRLTARDLAGLTPSGRPVVLRGGDALTADVPCGSEESLLMDIAIEVNPAEHGGPDEMPPAKYRLRAFLAQEAAARPAPAPDCLDLGRFLWRPGGPPRLAGRPAVRRLCAIRPLDADWRAYVDPLAKRLEALLKRPRGDFPSDALFAAYAAEVARLADEWLALPLPELARRLRFLNRLGERRPGDGPRLGLSDEDDREWREVPAARQPAALAALAEAAVRPPPRCRPLERGRDFELAPDGEAWAVTFLRDLGAGRLRVRFPGPPADAPTFTGPGVAQTLSRNGAPAVFDSGPVELPQGPRFRLAPRQEEPPQLSLTE